MLTASSQTQRTQPGIVPVKRSQSHTATGAGQNTSETGFFFPWHGPAFCEPEIYSRKVLFKKNIYILAKQTNKENHKTHNENQPF